MGKGAGNVSIIVDRDKRVDDILEKSCHIIDIFPDVVPCDRWDVFAQVEDFFLSKGEIGYLADKFTHIITKMVCYFSYEVYKGKWIGTVDVCTLAGMIREVILNKRGFLNVLLSDENTLIQVSGGDINLTVYNASDIVQTVMQSLANSEGLFWREGSSEIQKDRK